MTSGVKRMLYRKIDSKTYRLMMVPALLLLIFQSACTTTATVGQRQTRNVDRVMVGDTVRILTRHGAGRQFVVIALTLTSIIGTHHEVFCKDITRVDVRETDGWRQTDLTVASILGAPLLFVDGHSLASISSTTGPGQ